MDRREGSQNLADYRPFYMLAMCMSVSQGTFTSLVFFCVNPEVRHHWLLLLGCAERRVVKRVDSARLDSTDSSDSNRAAMMNNQFVLDLLQTSAGGEGSYSYGCDPDFSLQSADLEEAYGSGADTSTRLEELEDQKRTNSVNITSAASNMVSAGIVGGGVKPLVTRSILDNNSITINPLVSESAK
jgi:hypothetical protein